MRESIVTFLLNNLRTNYGVLFEPRRRFGRFRRILCRSFARALTEQSGEDLLPSNTHGEEPIQKGCGVFLTGLLTALVVGGVILVGLVSLLLMAAFVGVWIVGPYRVLSTSGVGSNPLTLDELNDWAGIWGNLGQFLSVFAVAISFAALHFTVVALRETRRQSTITELTLLMETCRQNQADVRARLETLRRGQALPFMEQSFAIDQVDHRLERALIEEIPALSREDARTLIERWRELLREEDSIATRIDTLRPSTSSM